ncbi:hypothetical protein [Pseudoxanthomonas beigongshangi]
MAGRKPGTPKTGGRKKGTPNKMTGQLKEMILTALDTAGGVGYLVEQSEKNPTAFLTLVGKVLPMTVQGDPENPLHYTIVERRIVRPGNPDS